MQKLNLAVVLLFSIALPVLGERKIDFRPKVEYPQKAVSARMSGVVVVMATVNPDGSVTGVESKITGSDAGFLRDYAIENVRGWKFKSGREEKIDVTFVFRFVSSKKEEGLDFTSKSNSYGLLVSRVLPAFDEGRFVGDKLSPNKE